MKHRMLALCLLAPAAVSAAAADDYAYAWPLQTTGDAAAWQVELTPEIYAVLRRQDLRDLAVLNAAGEAVPVAPYRVRTLDTPREDEVDLPMFGIDTAPAGTPEALNLHIERDAQGKLRRVDLGATAASAPAATSRDLLLDASAIDAALTSLRLDWDPRVDISAQFEVAGSDDLQQWRTLVANATVIELHQDGNILARHQIDLHGVRTKYLRLHRLDGGAAIASLRVSARTQARSTLLRAAPVWIDATPVAAPAPPYFYYSLPAPLPVETIRLELASENSVARVNVASHVTAGGRDVWQVRAPITAFALHQGDTFIRNDEVPASMAQRAREWRVEPLTPLDRAPILHLAYRPDRIVFLAQGAGPYRLVAGSATADRADYPLEAALAQLRRTLGGDWQPPLAQLGARATVRGDAALAAPVAPRDWKTWILWAVLIGAAVLIAGLALSLLRKPPDTQ